MYIKSGIIGATLSLAALGISSSARGDTHDHGIGTWEGSGTASEVSGRDLGGFTVTVTRKAISGGKVRADGVVNLANGQRIVFWQEFENTRSHAFRLVSDRGTGGGEELLSDEPLDKLMARLDERQFLRVHCGAILNLEFLQELQQEGDRKYVARVAGAPSVRVPISRDKLDELRQRLGIL